MKKAERKTVVTIDRAQLEQVVGGLLHRIHGEPLLIQAQVPHGLVAATLLRRS